MVSAAGSGDIQPSRVDALTESMPWERVNDELIERLIIDYEKETRTVFPDTCPISPACDVRTFSDLQPGTFVS